MTDTEREKLIKKLSYALDEYFDRADTLDSDTRHLRTEFLHDIMFIDKASSWSLKDLHFSPLVMRPLNGEYRIRVLRRLTEINPEFLNPWNITKFFKNTPHHEPLVAEDVTEEHVAWAAVCMLVSGGTYAMYEGEDLGFLREPVEAAQSFLKNNWDSHRDSIREIIMTRRVYKPEDIETLMTGGEPLHKGAL